MLNKKIRLIANDRTQTVDIHISLLLFRIDMDIKR